MGNAAVNRLLMQAVEHYDAGRPGEAEALCADILSADPEHVSALHLSAVIAFVTDRAAEGAVLLQRVFSLDPDHAPAFGTLGDALAVKGEQEGAVAAFEVVLGVQDDGGLAPDQAALVTTADQTNQLLFCPRLQRTAFGIIQLDQRLCSIP